jgi:hypothetical protein
VESGSGLAVQASGSGLAVQASGSGPAVQASGPGWRYRRRGRGRRWRRWRRWNKSSLRKHHVEAIDVNRADAFAWKLVLCDPERNGDFALSRRRLDLQPRHVGSRRPRALGRCAHQRFYLAPKALIDVGTPITSV